MTAAVPHKDLANAIRALSMDAVEKAGSGHPGMPMGMADVATVLWTRFLKFDATAPDWPDRDRFVLSNGHGSMLIYSLLHLAGFEAVTIDELKRYRILGSLTPGHPEHGHTPGVETTTGPLGQGIATAVGMAFAEAALRQRFGEAAVDHYTYVFAGDGCLMEGISHEAASLAGHLGLGRLIVLFDDNGISIDGPTSLSISDDVRGRFEAYGWHTLEIDGHEPAAIEAAVAEARSIADRPSLIACKTVIGYGAPKKQGKESAHGAALGAEEVAGARVALGWPHPAFEVPEGVLTAWRAAGSTGAEAHAAWRERVAGMEGRAEFERRIAGRLPESWPETIGKVVSQFFEEKPTLATRKASEKVLDVLTAAVPELLGGSADLTHSNYTVTKSTKRVVRSEPGGTYVHYGVREHGMAAFMNGVALHRGFIPYGGTFLIFSDYCRPAIRLAALMGQRVVYVMTHDSIGLGEDGPTHQPVEHLASLRAMPGLRVLRPADAVETAECWQLAIEHAHGPSLLALSRQNLPAQRTTPERENLCARGAYVLLEAKGARAITLLATGSEVQLAVAARDKLAEEGIAAAVVSMPCWELFEEQDTAWKSAVLGTVPRIAIEAASAFGWTRYVADERDVVGLKTFGASGSTAAVYDHFGITVDAIVERAMACIEQPLAA